MTPFHYVYITTNIVTGKQYVGDRTCYCTPDKDSYLGSGRPLYKAVLKKYGPENFVKKILKICDSRKEAFDLQEKYIKKYNTLSPNGYNLSPKGGLNVKGALSNEGKERNRKSNIKTWAVKGKEFNGEKNPCAKLLEEQVLNIFEMGTKRKLFVERYSRYKKNGPPNYYEIAEMFNTNRATVQHITNGFQWSSITKIERTYKNKK